MVGEVAEAAAGADRRPSVASEITPRAAAVGESARPVLVDGEAVAAVAAGAAEGGASVAAVGEDNQALHGACCSQDLWESALRATTKHS